MNIEETSEDRRRRLAEEAEKKRVALLARLEDEGEDELAEQLAKCNQEFNLVCTNCGTFTEVRTHCMKRWCPACARRISAKRVGRYVRAAATMQWPLHVTLTVKNTQDISLETFRRLQAAFKKLRRQHIFRRVVGGVASIELTNRGRGWHPHIHLLLDCEWLADRAPTIKPFDSRERRAAKCKAAADELGRTWARLVGQRTASVKTRRCAGMVAVTEVLKYAVKPESLIECEDNPGDAIRAMQKARLFVAFGNCYGRTKEFDAAMEKPECTCGGCEQAGTTIPEFCIPRGKWR